MQRGMWVLAVLAAGCADERELYQPAEPALGSWFEETTCPLVHPSATWPLDVHNELGRAVALWSRDRDCVDTLEEIVQDGAIASAELHEGTLWWVQDAAEVHESGVLTAPVVVEVLP